MMVSQRHECSVITWLAVVSDGVGPDSVPLHKTCPHVLAFTSFFSRETHVFLRLFDMDSDSRQRPHEFSLLRQRQILTELPTDAAAAEEWVKPLWDTLARRVMILI